MYRAAQLLERLRRGVGEAVLIRLRRLAYVVRRLTKRLWLCSRIVYDNGVRLTRAARVEGLAEELDSSHGASIGVGLVPRKWRHIALVKMPLS